MATLLNKCPLYFILFSLFAFYLEKSFASYQSYGATSDTEYYLVPETHIWREYPRIWTVKSFSNYTSKFTLIYSLQEGNCKTNKLRFLRQTWVLREPDIGGRLSVDKKSRSWRDIDERQFELDLLTYMCTVKKEETD